MYLQLVALQGAFFMSITEKPTIKGGLFDTYKALKPVGLLA